MNLFKKVFNNIFPKVKKAYYDEEKESLTIEYTNNNIETFIGSGTVWHNELSFKRCHTFQEKQLSEIYTKINYINNIKNN